jgi:hypothetical protein
MSKRILCFALLSLALGLSACKRSGGVKAPEELAALTEAEAQTLAERLSHALRTCNQQVLLELIDVDAMLRAAVHGSAAGGEMQQGILAGMKESAADLPSQFCATSETANDMNFLRVHKRDGKQTLLYRALVHELLNYVEFYSGKSPDGRAKINNIYVYMNGQTIVDTLSQMLAVAMDDNSIVTALVDIGDKVTTDPATALKELSALPKKTQRSKPIQLLKIQAASGVDDATYDSTIAEFEALYPADPSLDLVSIDGFIVRKNYEAALKVVDRLDASIGGDPHLDTIRVSLLIEEGRDLERAIELAEKGLKDNPESEDAHYLMLGAYVANQDFGGTVAVMTLMGERFGVVFEEAGLNPSDPNYTALKASPEWQAYTAKIQQP